MNHKDLDVWKEGINFVKMVYQITSRFPDIEKFGLITQIRRAAVSVPANISEGAARQSDKEFIHFLYISLGSIAELETLFIISADQNYLNEADSKEIDNSLQKIRSMLIGLIRYLKNK
ncbi:MAG TPA: four helix bundle protein [Bacteroidales bacterium]|nr:four helix bundle protein [Bacteroidales bacterium]HPI85911.1 four helix bundle protein [Bacteroidales bacterium]HPM91260.1 four helix bundle protein [Bacteroidales bacterium]